MEHMMLTVRTMTVGAVFGLAVACASGDDSPEAAAEGHESAEAPPAASELEEPEPSVGTAPPGSREQVQDLWLLEGFVLVDSPDVDLEHALTDWLADASEAAVELPGDATFHVVEALDAAVTWPGGQPRDDVHVTAGLIETSTGQAFAVLATPDDGAPTIGLHGRLTFDLTPLEELEVGDRFSYAVALLQAYPGDAPDDEQGLGGLELLDHRLRAGNATYLAARQPDGQVVPVYSTGQVGEVIAGSRRGSVHPKADDLTGALEDAVDDCGSPLGCVADWFKGLGDGGSSSLDNALCNGNIAAHGCGPPSSQPEPLCLGPDCGQTTGEPYLTPFDGRTFAFQAAGEFVLARSDGIEVQARFVPIGRQRHATLTTALAFRAADHRVSLTMEERVLIARVDGDEVPIEELEERFDELGWRSSVQGDRLVQVRVDGGALLTVVARYDQPFLDFFLDVNEVDGQFDGLLGASSTGGPQGFVTRDGQELGTSIDRPTRYEVFGASWRIDDEESLFDYGPGESTSTFTDLSIPAGGGIDPDELDADDPEVARARSTCEATGIVREDVLEQCTFDLWATDDLAFLHSHVLADRGRQLRDGARDPAELAPWIVDEDDGAALAGSSVLEVEWSDTLRRVLDDVELDDQRRFEIVCPAAESDDRNRRVWGTDVYWSNSPLCLAAVHAGAMTFDGGGPVTVRVVDDIRFAQIEPVPRNGVVPERWPRRARGFEFVSGP